MCHLTVPCTEDSSVNGSDRNWGPHGAIMLVDSAPYLTRPEEWLSEPPIQRSQVPSAKCKKGRDGTRSSPKEGRNIKSFLEWNMGDFGYWHNGQSWGSTKRVERHMLWTELCPHQVPMLMTSPQCDWLYGAREEWGLNEVIRPSNSTAGHTPQGNQNWKRHMYLNVHSSTIDNSQDMEAT